MGWGLRYNIWIKSPTCSEITDIESPYIPVNFSSLKIEETYTLTTFVDQKLSLSVYSKSMYDSLVWLGFFDLSKLLEKISDWRSFGVLKIFTSYRPYSRSLYYFPNKFRSFLRGNHTSSIRATSPKFMYHIYQKLNITALQNYLNWCLICDMVGQVNVVFSLSFLKPILSHRSQSNQFP